MSEDKLRSAGAAALAKAVQLYQSDIWDPPARDHRPVAERWRDAITEMIGGDGRGHGLGWGWEGRYAGDGDFEWCGAFAARCWEEGGLLPLVRRESWASCYRLQRWASHRPTSPAAPSFASPPRLCVAFDEHTQALPEGLEVRPGDVLIVGGVGTGPGKHITLVERFDEATGTFWTYEGNAGGLGPDGKRRQGVIRGRRRLGLPFGKVDKAGKITLLQPPSTYHARWLIRPSLTDLS